MNKWYARYMIFIGTFGQFVFYSQFYTIIQNKSAQDVSLFGFTCGFVSVCKWQCKTAPLNGGTYIKKRRVKVHHCFLSINR